MVQIPAEESRRYIAVNADGRTRFVETDNAGLHFLRTVLLAFGFGQVPFDPDQPNVPHRCYMVAHPQGLNMVGRVVDHTAMIHAIGSPGADGDDANAPQPNKSTPDNPATSSESTEANPGV